MARPVFIKWFIGVSISLTIRSTSFLSVSITLSVTLSIRLSISLSITSCLSMTLLPSWDNSMCLKASYLAKSKAKVVSPKLKVTEA